MTDQNRHDIATFLTENPDFFVEFPDVVKTLEIPHECGEAISLLEYQIRVLRSDNKHLNQKMIDLIQVARENDLLTERMHKLTLDVMQCANIEELVPTVQDLLRDKFGVDIVHFRLLKSQFDGADQLGFRDPDNEGWSHFQDIIESSRINLGALTPDESKFLFEGDHEQIRSSAVLPLGKQNPIGILGLGSFATERFTRQMGTVYLQQMSTVISQALSNFFEQRSDQVSNG